MRIVFDAASRVGNAHLLQEIDPTLRDLFARNLVVRCHRLVDLESNPQHRIERAERVLKDHRDVTAADLTQLFGRHPDQVLALEQDLAVHDLSRPLDQAEDGHRRDALAAARLPDQPQRFAVEQLETNVAHGLDFTFVGEERGAQVLNLEDWFSQRTVPVRLEPPACLALLPRVEGVSQTVSEEVEGQQRYGERQCRK